MNNSSESVNMTQASPQVCSSDTEPVAISWIKTVVYLFLLSLALFGNALVIWVVYKYKRMHTAPNFLIVNIAVGDLFTAILTMIPTAVSMLCGGPSWVNDGPFGQVSCKLYMFSQGSSMACSIFSLTVLAFERFFVVVFPLWNVVTIRGTLWSIAVSWVAAFALSSPFFYAAKVRLFDDVPYCTEDWAPAFDPKRAPAVYTIVIFCFNVRLTFVSDCSVILGNRCKSLEKAHPRKHDRGEPSSVATVQEKRAEGVYRRGPGLCILLVFDAPEYVPILFKRSV
ncbi:hypothetical protein ACROYT_G007316 [Oculina patagonica]